MVQFSVKEIDFFQKFYGDVKYKDIVFQYPTRCGARVLDDLNLEVPPGKTIALIGPSGCGKSTIIQILERFYDPVSGTVASSFTFKKL